MHGLQIRPTVHNYRAPPTIPQSYIRVRAVMWECGEGQADTRKAVPIFILPRLCLTRNVTSGLSSAFHYPPLESGLLTQGTLLPSRRLFNASTLIYTLGHKKGANLFLSVTLSKIDGFNAVFTVRFRNEWHMRQYELHPPHVINVATLPCKS